MKKKIIIMISGRGSNMAAIADNICDSKLGTLAEISYVFSNDPQAPGLKTAKQKKIATHSISSRGKKRSEYNLQLRKWLVMQNPDYIILAGYMLIIPSELTALFKNRIINIHPADTNLHQGLHAYQWAWDNKLKSTKITIHYVDEGLDTGKIIDQAEVDLGGCASLAEVEQRGLKVEHQFYSQTLIRLFKK